MTPATALDVILGAVLLFYAVSGYRQGLLTSVAALAGFLGGGALAMAVLPSRFAEWSWAGAHPVPARLLLVVVVLGVAVLGQVVGSVVGRSLRSRLRAKPTKILDSLLGGVVTVVAASLLVWFVASGLRGSASPVARTIGESRIIRVIDSVVPEQTGRLFAGFRQMLDEGGFPRVFEGVQREPIVPVEPPSATSATPLVRAALGSVVKITGPASACRQVQEGSGFVAAPGRVVTNAHVVSGVTDPTVQVGGSGPAWRASVIAFDPRRDLAVLSVPGLPAPALPLGDRLESGAETVIAGFPHDGPLRVDPARVRSRLLATGADIYGQPGVAREIYSLRGRVEPGNSGGPLLDPQGRVVGVIFARSVDDDATGYALTLQEARDALAVAADDSRTDPVPTGACRRM